MRIVSDDWQTYKDAPAAYEAGSPNYPGVVGLGKAIEVLEEVGFDAIEAHEKVLNQKLVDGLKQVENVIIYWMEAIAAIAIVFILVLVFVKM